jgi:glycosyltransferase involved in cell wall biosynthesis
MRIGINTLFLVPDDVGGTEIYLRQNLKEMVNAEPDTVFVLFTSRNNEKVFRSDLSAADNVEYVQLPLDSANRPFRIVAEQVLLPRYIKNSSIDVLWSPGYTAPIRCSCPQAVTIHDLQYKTHPDDMSFLERKTLDYLVSSACRVCDAVIAVSEFSKREILKYNFASEEKVFAILEGVDPVIASTYETINPVLKPYILCVAHTYPHKNVHVLVDAFGQIAEKIPHDLVLVGKARRGEEHIQQSLDASHCKDRIHRLSGLEFSELAIVYQGADLFVLPSVYEGFGLPILEAMLAGIPVITTDMASLPEVGGVHAVYVQESSPGEFATAILDVMSWDVEKRQEKLRNALVWASSFTWQKSAVRTLGVVAGLIKEKQVSD